VREVVTRFAPSPTGFLHIGGARTALFSWAYAKRFNGQFILRIEDTDLERSSPQAIEAIKKGIAWLGLNYDGSIHFQTQRMERYKEVISQLLNDGHAYYCYATIEELEKLREEQKKDGKKPKYDGRWRPETNKVLPKIPFNANPVIRFKNPKGGQVSWTDLVKGEITIHNEELDDFIIARSDGTPTYNFCVVVDDSDMNISHVIRGDDHINNTPRQINLFKALNIKIPEFAHLSMILGADGQKLSKRHGSISVMEYKDMGFVPEAVKNYLARLGWSHGDEEIFTMDKFCSLFDFKSVISSAAQFSDEKLSWLNNHYIKEMNIKDLVALIDANQKDNIDILNKAVILYRDRAKSLNEIRENIQFFFKTPKISEDLINKYINIDSMTLVDQCAHYLNNGSWSDESINSNLKDFVKKKEIKFPAIAMPLRVILAGTDQTPSVGSILSILGKREVSDRLQSFKNNYDF
jgi:glutamyl-tRNA synthetase